MVYLTHKNGKLLGWFTTAFLTLLGYIDIKYVVFYLLVRGDSPPQ
jgi:hypothetical protein